MRFVLVLAAAALMAGCVSVPSAEEDVAPQDAATVPAAEPVVQEFEGHMTASALAPLAHQNSDMEMMVADVQREGFLLEVAEVPDVLQIDLEWTALTPMAEMATMVNVPTSTDGTVLDFFSEWSGSGSVCIRIPVEDIQVGPLSVMAHSRNAADVDYVIRVTTIGGDVTLHADRGHMEVEREDGEARDALPCEDAAA